MAKSDLSDLGTSMEWAVSEVQKQQAESLVRMEALRKQHLDWEAAVKSMLQQIRDTFSEEVETSARVELKRGSSTLSQRSTHFAGARELQKLRNSTARQDSPPVAIASSPTGPTAPSGTALTVRRHRTRSSENSRMLEEILSQPGSPERPRSNRIQGVLAWIVESTVFECVTGFVILLNMILIGAEAEMKVKGQVTDWAENIERFFLALYTVELLMRFAVGRWPLFRSGWFLLDFFLVCLGLLALVVIPTIEQGAQEGFEQVLIVRGLRLLRLARVLRMVHRFKVVWRLVSGLLSAWDTMVSTTGLIMIWLYIFGCVALEFITTDAELLADPATTSIVKENFGSLPKATLTLLQFVTMDAIANVYYPLVMAKPVLIIYFLPLLMFLSIGLMNLVTAVLVEHALEHASQEAEHARLNQKQRIKDTLPDLLKVFQGLDADGSGSLTRQELADVPISVLPPNVLENVSVDSMEDLFEMLDVDGGGTLTQDEFLEGLLSLLLLDVPMWAIQLQKQMLQLYKLVVSKSNLMPERPLSIESPSGKRTALEL